LAQRSGRFGVTIITVRKWGLTVVGFVDVLAVVVVFAMLLGPGEGSTEFHKREYVATVNELHGYTFLARVRRFCSSAIGIPVRPMSDEKRSALIEQTRHHRKALLETGFLVEREIPITGGMQISRTVVQLNSQPRATDPYTRGLLKTLPGNNRLAVVVIATANDVDHWEDVIRKADVQE
jgi:hypothetical protein